MSLKKGWHQRVLNDLYRTRLSRCRMIWLLPRPPSFPSPVSKLSLFLSLHVCRRSSLPNGGAKSYDSERAWSSINHSILSGCWHCWSVAVGLTGAQERVFCFLTGQMGCFAFRISFPGLFAAVGCQLSVAVSFLLLSIVSCWWSCLLAC